MKTSERVLYIAGIVAIVLALVGVKRANAELEAQLEGSTTDPDRTMASSRGSRS